MPPPRKNMSMRLLALGDSYTVGEGIAPAHSWPFVVSQQLPLDAPQVIATTGWTTDELATAVATTPMSPPYALVTLMIGVNDQYRGRSLQDYMQGFSPLLHTALALSGDAARTLVISIPDWGVTGFARQQGAQADDVARQINVFNGAAMAQAQREGCAWVDVTALSRQCGDQTDMLVTDRLHPSARQQGLWAGQILPTARQALSTLSPTG